MEAIRILYQYVESRMQTAYQSVALDECSRELERVVEMSVTSERDWS